MSKITNYVFMLLIFPAMCIADCTREAGSCYPTRLGFLEQQSRAESSDGYSHLTLNGVEIYRAKTDLMTFIYEDEVIFKSKDYLTTKTIFSFIPDEPCRHKEYYGYCSVSAVLDFSGDKPVISNGFTPDSGNSVIDWVSWGKANAIIVFQDESKFKYEKGRVERVLSEKK
ncbi:hypothetical protein B6O77_004544 [Salmonella enterica subsp. enterica serovar Mississippi]|nr:hypothetical protein [Salmonella enterica subsp. enterica serovar Mississippi]